MDSVVLAVVYAALGFTYVTLHLTVRAVLRG